ncbi:hypothetical protein GH714_040039 [Hevea brasiliensis]|uniref:Uncharacterized protein n=1 Tax=Hevea brasiliensis TaxID=3981 RepID=A0A6A6MJT8_HEVBR|nr:hypothetical protein GH714_040039 [Hevea brasiliensis]
MESIVQALELKFHTQHPIQSHPSLDFQVFFNNQTENDFNTLFRNLPISRKYLAAGVPGDFHDCLLPKSSLHFGHASYVLNWLSKIPEEVMDPKSPARDKDAIHCTGFAKEDAKMGSFSLKLLVWPMIFWALALWIWPSRKSGGLQLTTLLPLNQGYGSIARRSESFSIERIETIPYLTKQKPTVQFAISTIRAFTVEQIKGHFGDKIVDSEFEYFARKPTENFPFAEDQKNPQHIDLFILLKRNSSCNTV